VFDTWEFEHIREFAVLVGVPICIFLGWHLVRWRRRKFLDLKALGEELGLDFSTGGDGNALMHQKFMELESFSGGYGSRAETSNIFSNADHYVFDWWCSSSWISDDAGHGGTAAAVRLRGRTLPSFEIRPISQRGIARFIGSAGDPIINFAGDREFSTRFQVIGKDVQNVRGLLSAQTRQQLLSFTDWSIEAGAKDWIVVRPSITSWFGSTASERRNLFEASKRIASVIDESTSG
jgi:hypothetical protein